eukprot:8290937-Lingulodinium_polyedra.AAC.1
MSSTSGAPRQRSVCVTTISMPLRRIPGSLPGVMASACQSRRPPAASASRCRRVAQATPGADPMA